MDVPFIASLTAIICGCITIGTFIAKPWKSNAENIRHLQEDVRQLKADRDADLKRSSSQAELNRMILEALSALCKHGETGNSTGKLKQCSDKIDNYLFEKGGKM